MSNRTESLMKKTKKDLVDIIITSDDYNEKLKGNLNSYKFKLETSEGLLSQRNKEIENYKSDVSLLRDRLNDVSEKLKDAEISNETNVNLIDSLNNKIKQVSSELEEANVVNNNYKEAMDELVIEKTEFINNYNSVKKDYSTSVIWNLILFILLALASIVNILF